MVLLEIYTFLLLVTQLLKKSAQSITLRIVSLNNLVLTVTYSDFTTKQLVLNVTDLIHIRDTKTTAEIIANKVDHHGED